MNDKRDFFLRGRIGCMDELIQQAGTVDRELVRQSVQMLKEKFTAYGESIKLPADSTIEDVALAIIRATQLTAVDGHCRKCECDDCKRFYYEIDRFSGKQ